MTALNHATIGRLRAIRDHLNLTLLRADQGKPPVAMWEIEYLERQTAELRAAVLRHSAPAHPWPFPGDPPDWWPASARSEE